MGDNIPLTDPEGDSSLSFYDAAMDLENCNMSGTLLNTHGNQWCISCRNLKQTIEKMRDEYETNYKMLKEKIISTNDLIKRYKLKCDEFDVISKKLCETEKKLDISTRGSDGLMVRLRQAVEEQMPVKETNAKLGKKVKFQERLIAELQDQVGAVTTLQTQLNALKKESEREKGKLLAECTEVKQQHKQVLVSQKKGEEKLTKTLENMKTLKQQLSAAQRENKKLSKENEKLQLKLTRQQSAANKQGHLDVGKFATSDSKLARGHSRSPAERNLETEEDSLDLIFRDIGILSRLGWKDEERSIVSPLPSSPASSLNTTDEDSSDEELGNEVARLLEGEAEMADTSPMSMLPIDMSDDSSDSDVIDEVPFQCAESSVQQLVAVFEASPVKLGIRKVARPTAVDGGLRKRVGTVRDVGRCSVDTFGDEGISCDEMQCGSQVKITNVKCRDLNEEIEHDTIEQICSANMVECTHFTDMVECINSVDTVEQTHLADTVEQTHSADTVEQTQSADTVEQTHLANKVEQTHSADTVEQTHLADTVEQTHSADTVEQTPSADTVGQTHSVDTVEQTNSINAVEQTHSVDTVEQTHSAGTMEQTHLADTVEQAHSADTVEQTHLADTLEQTHSADTLEQTHSADTVEQTHLADTMAQTHLADTLEQAHLADTVEQTHSTDTVEQTHSADMVEQTHSADMVEQTHLDDSVEQTHSTDTVEQTHSADMVEQTHVADSVEQTHSADTLKQTHLADTVEQTHVADSVEQTHSADTLKQTHSADTVEQTHSADTLEQTHLADTLEQTHSADTVEQAHSADTMEQTHSIDTVEQTHSIDTVEKTHSIDTVEQTHSPFTSPVCGSMTVENKTKTVTNTSSVIPPETPVQVLLEVTPPEMQVLPEVTTPKMSVLPEVTLPKMPVLPEVTPPEMQVLPEVTLPNMPVLPEVTLPKMPVLPEVTLPKMPVLPEVTTPKMSVLPQVTLPKVHVLQVTKTLPQIQTSKPSRTKVTAPSVQLEKTSTNNSVKTLNQQREVNIIGKKAETVLLANKDVDLTKLTDKDLQRVLQNTKTTVKDTSVVGKKAETVLLANKDVEKAKMAEKSLQRVPRNTPATVKDTSVASMSGLLNPTAVSDKKRHLPAPLQADTVGSVTMDNEADLLDSLFGLPQPVSPLPVSPAHQQETGSRRFFPDVDEHQVKPMKETLSQTPDGCWPVQEKVSSSVGKPQGKAGKRKKAQGGTGSPNKKRTSVNQYPVSSLMSSAGLELLAPGHTVIDEELQLLLRGSVLPAQTATNISRGQPTIHPDVLVNCVANILYASKADVLPAIHSYCTAEPQQLTQQQLWQPFMTADEHQILELLLHLDGQRQFVNIFEMLRVKILTILHSTENVLIPGRTALCRLFTAVCRMKGDISRVRVLAYDTVHSSFHAFPRMILAIACVWPEALKAGGGEVTCVMRCLQYVIHKNLQESKVRHSQMWQCLAKLCGWQKHSDVQEDATVLATVAIEKLLHSSDEAHLYDAEKALELLSMKEGWQWTNNQLIIKLIWPVLQQWATGGQHPFSDRAIGSLLRVLGVVTNNCPVQYASAAYDIAQTLQALLNHSVNSAVPVCDTIQEAVLEALMLLAPFKPDLSAHACYTWVKQRHKQKCLGDHVKSKIRDFVEHYKLQFKYLTQLTNML